ncbi:TspO/MBR family protein [Flavicella marina]|uniref:TspO/MBR family protein n=1 Tax=Flavicella marina TaxID=1475951 RepID=UPI001264ECA4|nr:TspO/MBR family protein [Flavicella marina]
MKKIYVFLFFLFLNFAALGVGTLLMNSGPTSEWYANLNKAPWTPPGWVFGAAWTSIMVFFSIYMTVLSFTSKNKNIWWLFGCQWLLNVSWNWIFFNQHQLLLGQIVLVALTLLVGYFMINYRGKTKLANFFVLPYFLWLLVANSLNLYTMIYN